MVMLVVMMLVVLVCTCTSPATNCKLYDCTVWRGRKSDIRTRTLFKWLCCNADFRPACMHMFVLLMNMKQT